MDNFRIGDIVKIKDENLNATRMWWGLNDEMRALAKDRNARFVIDDMKASWCDRMDAEGMKIRLNPLSDTTTISWVRGYWYKAEDLAFENNNLILRLKRALEHITPHIVLKEAYPYAVVAVWAVLSLAVLWHCITTY
jgi:hypothetical protein